ncbi:MAG: InlB B-repeat-containing protein, partial [Oscillospiraceae bacterium]|nr:InlB B-repeat-containing protein [Oscillospiraceae bacterium]
MKKRISSIIIALFMVVGAFFPFPFLQDSLFVIEASANPGGGGSGTAADPWRISTQAHLVQFRTNVLNGTSYSGQHVKLMNNIALTAETNGWTPIGTHTARFSGTFCGGGYTISGMNLSRTIDNKGFFGVTDGVVRNLTVTGNITGSGNWVGGLTGVVRDGGLVERCRVDVNINLTAGNNVGGIAGANFGTIQDNYVHNSVVSAGSSVGGIVGNNYINEITATSAIIQRNLSRAPTVQGNNSVGGVLGVVAQLNANNVRNNVALCGAVRATGGPNRGRIVGNWNSNATAVPAENRALAMTLQANATSVTQSTGTATDFNGVTVTVGTANTTVFSWFSDTVWNRTGNLAATTNLGHQPVRTLTYNLNGGTGTVLPAMRYGNGLNATVASASTSNGAISRTGYTFNGWNTAANGTGTVRAANAVFAMTADVTLFAQWRAITSTVTFNMQSGGGGTTSVTATYDAAMPAITRPTRTGYTFQGYFGGAGGTGTRYYNADGTSARTWNLTGNTSLHAHWTPNVYNINYNNTGTAYHGTNTVIVSPSTAITGGTASTSVTYDAQIPASVAVPARSGYTFMGYWTTNAASGGVQWYNGSGARVNTAVYTTAGNTQLWARWQANTYTATFDRQSGTGGNTSSTVTFDVTMPTITPPTRTGYTFQGYFSAVNGGGTRYFNANGTGARTCNFTANITLYAHWTANTNTIFFDRQGGTGGSANLTAVYDSVLPALTRPTRTGYTFEGYFESANGGGMMWYNRDGAVSPAGRVWIRTADLTLHAHWSPNTYNVTLDTNGGVGGSTGFSIVYDSAVKTGYSAPTRTGYVFGGYWTGADGTGSQVISVDGTLQASVTNYTGAGGIWQRTAATTLYARWIPNTYTITLNRHGGTGGSGNATVNFGAVPAITLPSRPGYTFAGYWTAEDSSGVLIIAANGTMQANVSGFTGVGGVWQRDGNATFHARWTANTYTISFNGNGSTSGTMLNQGFTYDQAQLLADNQFTRTGYTFGNWNTAQNGTGTVYVNRQSVNNLSTTNNATIQLFAQWTANTTLISLSQIGATTSGAATHSATFDSTPTQITSLPRLTGYSFNGYWTETSGGTRIIDENGVFAGAWSDPSPSVILYPQWVVKEPGGTLTSPLTPDKVDDVFADFAELDNTTSPPTIKLTRDVHLTQTLELNTSVIIDMNGFGIFAPLNTIAVRAGGAVAIEIINNAGGTSVVQGGHGINGSTGRFGVQIDTGGLVIGAGVTVRGGNGASSDTGNGGNGGAGIRASARVVNNGTVIGGNGGDSENARGGNGGAGVHVSGGSGEIINKGIIRGGNGGSSGFGMGGDGGIGTVGNTNNGGEIYGGDGGNLFICDCDPVCDADCKAGKGGIAGDDITGGGTALPGNSGQGRVITITFNANGGELNGFPQTRTAKANEDFTFPNFAEPFRIGHTFMGWENSVRTFTQGGTYEADDVNGLLTGNGMVTVFAVWTANKYDVDFDSTGGSAVDSLYNIQHGETVPAPPAPTRTGYSFGGWYSDSALANPWIFSSNEVVSNTTLYAKWNDDIAPTGTVKIGSNVFAAFINTISFGLFFNSDITVEITGEDCGSGVAAIEYSLNGTDNWHIYTGSFTVPPNFKGRVYARITDNAGNVTIIASGGTVIYTDSEQDTASIEYIKGSVGDVTAAVKLNGNTVAGVRNGGNALSSSNFSVTGSTITFYASYLDSLEAGSYTLTVSYNPMGESFVNTAGNDEPQTTEITLLIKLPPLEGAATISGTNAIGQDLSVDTSALTGGGGAFGFQWQADGASITGANNAALTLTGAEAGKIITCIITRSDADGEVTATLGETVPYNIAIVNIGNAAGDTEVTLSASSGRAGDIITLSYVLGDGGGTDTNTLFFTGGTGLVSLTQAGASVAQNYAINTSDTASGVITITATFTHSYWIARTLSFPEGNQLRAYGDANFTNPAAVSDGTGLVTYISDNPSVAAVDENTGEITIISVGSAVISASVTTDNIYIPATASYTLTVEKAEQSAPQGLDKTNETRPLDDGKILGVTAGMEYKRSTDLLYTAVIGGEITGLSPGEYHVRYAETATHNASPDAVIIIEEWIEPEYFLTLTTEQNGVTTGTDSGNYIENNLIDIAAAANTGYTFISWTVSGANIADNTANPLTFLMPANDVTVTANFADITPPTGEITIGTNAFTAFLNTITFGLFFSDTIDVTVEGADSGSGVAGIEYYLSESAYTSASAMSGAIWESYAPFSISPSFKGYIYARITDNAGNEAIIRADGVVVYTDSMAVTTEINHFLGGGNKTAEISLGSNTFDEIHNGAALLTAGDYGVSGNIITIYAAYLNSLAEGSYTLTVSYNPLGEEFTSGDAPATTEITLNIIDPNVTITPVAGQSKVFGADDPQFTFTNSAGLPGSAFTGTLEREQGEDAGAYAFELGTLAPTDNSYSLNLSNEVFEITKTNILIGNQHQIFNITFADTSTRTVNLESLVTAYNLDGKPLTYTVQAYEGQAANISTGASVQDGTLSFNLESGLSIANVGETTVIPVNIGGFTNYSDVIINVVVTLTDKTVSEVIVAAPTNIHYGEALPAPLAVSTGGDDFDFHYDGITADGFNTPYSDLAPPALPGIYVITATLDTATNLGIGVSESFRILPKPLEWSAGTVEDKVYDGNTNATILTEPELLGVINGDDVTAISGNAGFASANVGSAAVTAGDYSVTGADLWKYAAPTAQPMFLNAAIICSGCNDCACATCGNSCSDCACAACNNSCNICGCPVCGDCGICDICEPPPVTTTTEPPVTTTEPPVTTTEPPVTTTTPPIATTTTNRPGGGYTPPVTTTPLVTVTTTPPVTTTTPAQITTIPPVTTSEPPTVVTSPPADTQEAPPPVTTNEPTAITEAPPIITIPPAIVTAASPPVNAFETPRPPQEEALPEEQHEEIFYEEPMIPEPETEEETEPEEEAKEEHIPVIVTDTTEPPTGLANLLSDIFPPSPAVHMSLDIEIGTSVAGKAISLEATGLMPLSELTITIHSTPRVVGTSMTCEAGSISINTVFPDDLEQGNHVIIAEGICPDGFAVQAVAPFQLDREGILTAFTGSAQLFEPIDPGDSRLARSLIAGVPLYDAQSEPETVAQVAVTFGLLGGIATIAGVSKKRVRKMIFKNNDDDEDDDDDDEQGWGDRFGLWKLSLFRKTGDKISVKLQEKTARTSFILNRFAGDGSWARAMFGSGGYLLWLAGIALGAYSSMQMGYHAMPPAFIFVVAIVMLGILDSGAGFLAWATIAVLAVVNGNAAGVDEIRTLVGMFTLFATTLILGGTRPLRRKYDAFNESKKRFVFDRFADYVMPTIYIILATSAILNAINGLSGLEFFSGEHFTIMKAAAIGAYWLRMLLEDFAENAFPMRNKAVRPEETGEQIMFLQWGAMLLYAGMFMVITTPFFGVGAAVIMILAFDIVPWMLSFIKERLP